MAIVTLTVFAGVALHKVTLMELMGSVTGYRGQVAYISLKHLPVLGIAWEAIDKELVVPALRHGLLQEPHCDLRRHNLALLNHVLNHGPAGP